MASSEYVTQPGDSLPSIAEACGHPGEWLLIAAWNPDLADVNNIQPGMTLILPDLTTWPAPGDPEASDSTTRSTTSTSSSSSKR
jgi:LysM repeat protein